MFLINLPNPTPKKSPPNKIEMKRNQNSILLLLRFLNRKWLMPVTILTAFSLVLLLTLGLTRSAPHTLTAESKLASRNPSERSLLPRLPRLAYLISGTKGDAPRVKRLLQAVYHPRNYYVVHLDLEASESERVELGKYAWTERVLRDFGNVMVVGEADLVTQKGPTMIASTLHAVAILLKEAGDWDWFINLSASDYPLMPQDDILHIFSYLPRDLNFLEHTSDIGWQEYQRARPIIIDPGLYHSKKSGVFWAKEKRASPYAFKLFAGSEWVMLTKSFLEFCIWGWDNLPRILLMYYTNFLSSTEGYFHTVICNHRDYQNTTVNHDLHYQKWDNPPRQQPLSLTIADFEDMAESGAPFARTFAEGDPVLNKIDDQLLRRSDGRLIPGGWCVGDSEKDRDPCVVYGNTNAVKPTLNSKRLEKLIVTLLDSENFRSKQCK